MFFVALAIALLAGSVAAIHYGLPYKRHLEVQSQLASFRADPSQDNAARLAHMIITGRASQADAEEILRTWLDPKVVVRKSYRPGTPIDITLVSGNETGLKSPRPMGGAGALSDEPVLLCLEENYHTILRVRGLTPDEGHLDSASVHFGLGFLGKTFMSNASSSPDAPHNDAALVISKPGVYPGVLAFEGTATTTYPPDTPPRGVLDKALILLGLRDERDPNPPQYRCAVELPLEIDVEEGPDQLDGDEASAAALAQAAAVPLAPAEQDSVGFWHIGQMIPLIQKDRYVALVAFRSAYHPSRRPGQPAEPGTRRDSSGIAGKGTNFYVEGEFTLVERLHLAPPALGCVSGVIPVDDQWGGDEAENRTGALERVPAGPEAARLYLIVAGNKDEGVLGSWFYGPIEPGDAKGLQEFVDYLLEHPFEEIPQAEAETLARRPDIWMCRLGLARLESIKTVNIKPFFTAMQRVPADDVAGLLWEALSRSSAFSEDDGREFRQELTGFVESAEPRRQVAALDRLIEQAKMDPQITARLLRSPDNLLANTLIRLIGDRQSNKDWTETVDRYRELLAILKGEPHA